MEGSITIPAAAIWSALAGSGGLIIGAIRYFIKAMAEKDRAIVALQDEIKQKYKDDLEYYRRIEAERGNA